MDQSVILGNVWVVQISLYYMTAEGREVNITLMQNFKEYFHFPMGMQTVFNPPFLLG